MFARKKRDIIKVNYAGQLPEVVAEFLDTTEDRPKVLGRRPLVLSVEEDRNFLEKLLSVVRKADFTVEDVEVRRQA